MLIDDVFKHFSNNRFSDQLKKITILKSQNVADYFWSGTNKEDWELKDFPNCAPPWDKFWIEWKQPKKCLMENNDIKTFDGDINFGCLIESKELDEVDFNEMKNSMPFKFDIHGFLKKLDIRWVISFSYFSDMFLSIKKETFLAENKMLIKSNGEIFHKDGFEKTARLFAVNKLIFNEDNGKIVVEMLEGSVKPISLLAMSFCHCKNTELKEERYGDALVKKRAKIGKFPVNRFYTLEIKAMRKILKESGDETGIKKALHICRGHFKDFRGTKGLFGKHRDLYWWDMHSRGSSERGEVIKDYAVAK